MNTDYSYLLSTILPACHAAYDAQYGCHMPIEGWQIVDYVRAIPLPTIPLKVAALRDGNLFGYIATNADTALISFRGTQDATEWMDDLEVAPAKSQVSNGHVASGFQELYLAIRPQMWAILEKLSGVPNVVTSGHSMGGALAILAAADIAMNRKPATRPSCYTLAGPAVASLDFPRFRSSFRDNFNAHVDCLRVVNLYDIVPHSFPPPTYVHVGFGLKVNGGSTLDPREAHELDAYEAGLKKLTVKVAA
jgi:triacylglycerol lipase